MIINEFLGHSENLFAQIWSLLTHDAEPNKTERHLSNFFLYQMLSLIVDKEIKIDLFCSFVILKEFFFYIAEYCRNGEHKPILWFSNISKYVCLFVSPFAL